MTVIDKLIDELIVAVSKERDNVWMKWDTEIRKILEARPGESTVSAASRFAAKHNALKIALGLKLADKKESQDSDYPNETSQDVAGIFDNYRKIHFDSEKIVMYYLSHWRTDVRHLCNWVLSNYLGNYGLFKEEHWENKTDNMEGLAELFSTISSSIQSGNIAFVVVNGVPRLSFYGKERVSSLEYYLFPEEVSALETASKAVEAANKHYEKEGSQVRMSSPTILVEFIDDVCAFTKAYAAHMAFTGKEQ